MASNRIATINQEIQKELSNLLRNVKDPRVQDCMISVTRVETTPDLRWAKVYVSFLQEDGIPGMAEKVAVLPPRSRMGSISDIEREAAVKGSLLYSRYAVSHDPESAFEFALAIAKSLGLTPKL